VVAIIGIIVALLALGGSVVSVVRAVRPQV